jgi:hypothetical protein
MDDEIFDDDFGKNVNIETPCFDLNLKHENITFTEIKDLEKEKYLQRLGKFYFFYYNFIRK